MTRRHFPNIALIALVVSCFIQIGAQLFAVSVIARVVQSAPPRSFAIFEGKYGYDSSAFWDIVPTITCLLFLVAIVANWNTGRRTILFGAFGLFLLAGAVAGFLVEPTFAAIKSVGYRDQVDPLLQARAARWYAYDWGMWFIELASGIALLTALARPIGAHAPRDTSDPDI